jgi:hypothetical protein
VWLQPGKEVRVNRVGCNFGSVSFTIAGHADGATVSISPKWREAPKSVVFHLPWFVEVSSAKADGKPADISGGAIALSPNVRRLELKWTWREHPELSYERAVELWIQKNYHPTPDMDRDFLFPHVRPTQRGR